VVCGIEKIDRDRKRKPYELISRSIRVRSMKSCLSRDEKIALSAVGVTVRAALARCRVAGSIARLAVPQRCRTRSVHQLYM